MVRRSDSENLCVLHVHIRIDPRWNEKIMAKAAARQMVNEMKKALKERKAA